MENKELWDQIAKVVDQWVSEVLRSRFLEKPQGQKPRSLWDKFKQGVANWWWGPDGDKHNKYKWRNRFGDELGVTESFDPSVFTLHEYMEIRGLVDSVESRLDESGEEFDNLRLMRIVRDAAESLKKMLFDALVNKVDEVRPPNKVAERPTGVGEAGGTDSPSAESGSVGVPPVKRVDDPRKATKDSKVSQPAVADTSSAPVEPSPEGENPKSQSSREATTPNRKNNAQRIKEAAEEVAKMSDAQKHALKPEKDWIKEGSVRKDRLPHLIAWMAMKTHRNPLDDEHIKQELEHTLGSEVGLGIPAKSGSLERYLRAELGSGFEEAMGKLGIKADGIEKDKESDKKSREPSELVPSKDKEASTPESREDKNEAEGLKAYLYEGDKPREVEAVARLVFDFIEKLSDGMDKDKKERLEDWFDSEMEHLENKDKRDAFDHLHGSLLSSDTYLEKISNILGLDEQSVKRKMIEFVKSTRN